MTIRVVHHSKTLGFGGTDKVAQIMCEFLNVDPEFEVYLAYRDGDNVVRYDHVRKFLDESQLVPYNMKHASPVVPPYIPAFEDLSVKMQSIKPDIFHIHRSGYMEWPGMSSVVPSHTKIVETNIFGDVDRSNNVHLSLYISDFIKKLAMSRGGLDGPVLYNPTKPPVKLVHLQSMDLCSSRRKLESHHRIPSDAIILGRVGQQHNFDPIALKAFARIEKRFPHAYYCVVNPCDKWISVSRELGIENIRFLDPLVTDNELSSFLQAIDIYAHARSDGECCSCCISEAMIHALPAVTHKGHSYNGHVEQLADCGFIADYQDDVMYETYLRRLLEAPELMQDMGGRAHKRAMKLFAPEVVIKQLKEHYLALLS